jgi:hypothetical protein
MATLNGTGGNDVRNGGSANDLINLFAGSDKGYGNAGSDRLYGGDGIDTLFGGTGGDLLSGGNQNDSAYGGSGADRINGDSGNDYLSAGFGDSGDTVYGGLGNDYIEGANWASGGNGNDIVYGEGDASLLGENGNDTLHGSYLYGGAGNDRLHATGDYDYDYASISAQSGNDVIYSEMAGWDTTLDIYGDNGKDTYHLNIGTYDILHFDNGEVGSGSLGESVHSYIQSEDVLSFTEMDGRQDIAGQQDLLYVGYSDDLWVNQGEVGFTFIGGDTIVLGNDGYYEFQIALEDVTVDLNQGGILV